MDTVDGRPKSCYLEMKVYRAATGKTETIRYFDSPNPIRRYWGRFLIKLIELKERLYDARS